MTLEEDYKANYLSGSLGQKRLANRWGVNRNQIFGQHRDGRRNWVQMLSLPSRPALGTQLPPQIVTSPGLSPTQQPSGQQRHFKIRTEFSSPTMLSTLRQKVTGEQRALLDIIWEEFVETGTWPETFKIHRVLNPRILGPSPREYRPCGLRRTDTLTVLFFIHSQRARLLAAIFGHRKRH